MRTSQRLNTTGRLQDARRGRRPFLEDEDDKGTFRPLAYFLFECHFEREIPG
jgi:hypothetical protein